MRLRTERALFLVENVDLAMATGIPEARWEPFQLAHLNDDSTFRIEDKARQIAWSWLIAAEGVADAILNKRDSIYVSINHEEAKEKIRYARSVIEALRPDIRPRLRGDSVMGIEFPNGARLSSLPARAPRGRARSNVYLDEFAHTQRDRAIYTAALPVISKGGRLRIGSSPLGARGQFWEVYNQKLRRYPGYYRKHTPWWETFNMCDDVFLAVTEAPKLTTKAAVERFGKERLQIIYDNMPEEDFEQEYCHLAGTKIMLANGTTKNFSELNIGDKLPYQSNGFLGACEVRAFHEIGNKPIVQLTTETGEIFQASSNHKIRDKDKKAVQAQDANHLVRVFMPVYSTGDKSALARLVGYNLGDGTVARRRQQYTKVNGDVSVYPSYLQASFYASDKRNASRIADDFIVSGIRETSPSVLPKKESGSSRDSYQVHVTHRDADILEGAGCVIGKKVHTLFFVPEWILRGDDNVKIEFLAALWGAEGNTPKARGKKPRSLVLSMFKAVGVDGRMFFDQLQGLLLEFGVSSTITEKQIENRVRYSLRITGGEAGVNRYFEKIGYRYCYEKEKLAFLWRNYFKAASFSSRQREATIIRLHDQGLSFAKIGEKIGIHGSLAHRLFSDGAKQAPHDFPGFDVWVGRRYSDERLSLKVIKHLHLGQQPVFNITVDSPDQSYLLADGTDNFNCGEFVDESNAWITWEEIFAVQDDDLFHLSAKCKNGGIDEATDLVDITLQAIRTGDIENVLSAGVDIGRTRNTTEIFIVGTTSTKQLPLRVSITLDNCDFDSQLEVMVKVMSTLPVALMFIDRNGIGMNIAEKMEKLFPTKAQGVDFTNASKKLWATNSKMLIQQQKTPLPVDRDTAYQIHSIKRVVSASKNLIFDTERNAKHHADRYWSWALALAAASTPVRTIKLDFI